LVPCLLAARDRAILFMAKRITFVKPDGSECTTRSGERANCGAPPVLVTFGDYDAMRLPQFAAEHGGRWSRAGSRSEQLRRSARRRNELSTAPAERRVFGF